ncbi:GNAT family N-acetyltransferase [Streptomyces sp. NPDC001941]|uniref:GNAT family N-acetyltransferase n=1 Tax=Streptomyces sp. NPDC001941 TaxID=3154659 RepID=UPI00332E84EC
MREADCAAVAEVRVRGWQFAYAGLIPDSYLDAMDVAEETVRRKELFAEGNRGTVQLVAEADGEVLGWAAYGPYREDDAEGAVPGLGELYAIYVLPRRVSTGVGWALLAEAQSRAVADGYRELRLWVLKENGRARRFYERAGYVPDGAEEPFEVDGVTVAEVRYVRELPRG